MNCEDVKAYVNKIFYMILVYMDSIGNTGFKYNGQVQISLLLLTINFY